jgi:hypothetical protein
MMSNLAHIQIYLSGQFPSLEFEQLKVICSCLPHLDSLAIKEELCVAAQQADLSFLGNALSPLKSIHLSGYHDSMAFSGLDNLTSIDFSGCTPVACRRLTSLLSPRSFHSLRSVLGNSYSPLFIQQLSEAQREMGMLTTMSTSSEGTSSPPVLPSLTNLELFYSGNSNPNYLSCLRNLRVESALPEQPPFVLCARQELPSAAPPRHQRQ